MSEPIVKHEIFEFEQNKPYQMFYIYSDIPTDGKNILMNHWHDELEIAYGMYGHGKHYINGEEFIASQERLVTTNSGFIHSVIPDKNILNEHKKCTFLIVIQRDFLKYNFPEYENFYFTNGNMKVSPETLNVIKRLMEITDSGEAECEYIKVKGILLELLYEMMKEGTVKRSDADDINVLKNIERMKGVISFIENNFREKITQSLVAQKFYFSPSYFSKYFKKCTGLTFVNYLTNYRVQMARNELINSDKSISDIALSNGFSDDRRFIIAFKERYNTTPLQYRKQYWNNQNMK